MRIIRCSALKVRCTETAILCRSHATNFIANEWSCRLKFLVPDTWWIAPASDVSHIHRASHLPRMTMPEFSEQTSRINCCQEYLKSIWCRTLILELFSLPVCVIKWMYHSINFTVSARRSALFPVQSNKARLSYSKRMVIYNSPTQKHLKISIWSKLIAI